MNTFTQTIGTVIVLFLMPAVVVAQESAEAVVKKGCENYEKLQSMFKSRIRNLQGTGETQEATEKPAARKTTPPL